MSSFEEIQLKNVAEDVINPATEDTLADILTELELKANLSETQPVSAASLPLPSGASTSANQTNGDQKTQIISPVESNGAIKTINQQYGFAIAEGYVTGHSVFSKRGYHPATTNSETTLWVPGTQYVFPTVGQQMEVVSTSAQDGPGGTGVLTMHLHYLSSDYVAHEETITLNGLTPVTTTATNIFKVNAFHGSTFGSTGKSVGTVSIRHLSGSPIYSQMAPLSTACRCSVYTVPLGKVVYIADILFSAAYSTSGKAVRMTLHASIDPDSNENVLTGGTIFYPLFESGVVDASVIKTTQFPYKLPKKTDIKVSVQGETNAICTSEIRGWIEDAD